MNEVAEFCKHLKQEFKPYNHDAGKPVRFWSEKDVLQNTVVDAFVIILRTRGCSWALCSGCTMCGYFTDSAGIPLSSDELIQQFTTAMNQYSGEPVVKLFTSGSFFDDQELPVEVRSTILSQLAEKTKRIVVESRPEYLIKERLDDAVEQIHPATLEVGVGLETADDRVREYAVNKRFAFRDYAKAAETVKNHKALVKTYVLVKPPFLTEKEAIIDCLNTVRQSKKYTDTISFNPTNVQRHTLVEFLWKRRQYRPPWLWSIVELLKSSKKQVGSKRLQCDVVGGGSIRGAHNCGGCDRQVLKAIASFSLSQDVHVFDGLSCPCKRTWEDQLELEPLGFGSLVNLSER